MFANQIESKAELIKLDEARDLRICGMPLSVDRATKFAEDGAHDPTATYYFILEDLFAQMEFTSSSSLLDVGCSAGRTLAFFADAQIPGHATGIELDPELARVCQSWTGRFANLTAIQGNVLNLSLNPYTHFYLFNPFDTSVLIQFVEKIESEVNHPITLCHMSDNGENYTFWDRAGWNLHAEGEFHVCQNVQVYGCPQHYSIWEYNPQGQNGNASTR